jgi:membrane associated rhomboid family serine protease
VIPGLTSSKLCTRWIIAVIVCSAIAALGGRYLTQWLVLSPIKVLHGQLWRLVTWPFVELGPFTLIVTCAAIIKFGDPLARTWGDSRLQRFAVHIALGTGIATVVLALLAGGAHGAFAGGFAMCNALVIAYARQFPWESIDLYGLVLRGPRLIGFILLVNLAYAIFGFVLHVAPQLAACALAIIYPRDLLARR